jgi:hypothetical protein
MSEDDNTIHEWEAAPAGEDFTLIKKINSILAGQVLISETDVPTVTRLVQSISHSFRERRTSQTMRERGISPIIAIPAVTIATGVDALGASAILDFRDQDGNRSGFSLSKELVEDLIERLTRLVSQLIGSSPGSH